MEVLSVAKVEEFEKENGDEDEIELSLELSIGRKSYTKSNPLHNKSMDSSSSCPKIGGLDFTEEAQISVLPRSVVAQIDPATDQQSKREIQALRRQEARKKREEKLKIKAISRGKKGNFSSVDGDWERRENHDDEEDNIVVLDEEEAEPPRKKEKNEKMVQNHEEEELVVRDLNLTLNNNGSNSTGQMQYPYRQALQYVSFTNGLVHPYGVVPCCGSVAACNGNGIGGNEGQKKEKRVNLGNGGGNEVPEKEKRVSFEPAVCRSFRPYNRNSEQNGNGKLDGSSGGSSSAVSDYQNSSLQGGNNSDNGSSSSKFPQENLSASSACNRQEEKSEKINCDSNGMKSNETEEKATTNHIANMVSSSIHQSSEAKCSEEQKSATELADPLNQPILLSTQDPIPPALLKEETTNGVSGKPPILQTEHHGAPSLPQMPCVSTTGNGPNGKTITGILYRYTKTEVSIVCVCHGTSFSPAEFVEHAGGVDVAHPLRHITLIPSAFV